MIERRAIKVESCDGHTWSLVASIPRDPHATALWLPALGVAAKHYLPLADAMAARGIAMFVHEWRGNGSSNTRAGRLSDWGYQHLLTLDIPGSERIIANAFPHLPRVLGGHSLGGQLACCRLALSSDAATALWLVGSGSPYWRAFPAPLRYGLPPAYGFMSWLARTRGALPGHAIGFGGNEARTLIADWARTALGGSYAAHGIADDIEAAMARVEVAVRAVAFSDDWLAPASSLQFLLSKLPRCDPAVAMLDPATLGFAADHFSWMQQPQAIAGHLAG